MTFDVLGDINWLAVIVGGLAYFILGAIWYAPPVFGRAWMRASGMEMPEERPGPGIYILPLVGNLVAALALAMLARATASDNVAEGLALGAVTGIGFAVTVIATTGLFDPKKPKAGVWAAITAGYHLVGIIAAAVIVAVWD